MFVSRLPSAVPSREALRSYQLVDLKFSEVHVAAVVDRVEKDAA